jgi:hypothetical protein
MRLLWSFAVHDGIAILSWFFDTRRLFCPHQVLQENRRKNQPRTISENDCRSQNKIITLPQKQIFSEDIAPFIVFGPWFHFSAGIEHKRTLFKLLKRILSMLTSHVSTANASSYRHVAIEIDLSMSLVLSPFFRIAHLPIPRLLSCRPSWRTSPSFVIWSPILTPPSVVCYLVANPDALDSRLLSHRQSWRICPSFVISSPILTPSISFVI